MRFILAFIALAACTDGGSEPRQYLPSTQNPSFTLLISNQSFDLDAVDIAVRIDGRRAVAGTFHVEGQHTWVPFDFGLTPGQHTLEVASSDTSATLTERFVVGQRNWGVLSFWYYPVGSPEPTPEMFSFALHDEQPLFD